MEKYLYEFVFKITTMRLNTTITLDEKYKKLVKDSGLQLSKFVEDALEHHFFDEDDEELKTIEEEIIGAKKILMGLEEKKIRRVKEIQKRKEYERKVKTGEIRIY